MKFSAEMQALRVENLEIARMETIDMFPQRDLYRMSVVRDGQEHRIFYSWPELKGHKFCREYFAQQDKINSDIAEQTESDIGNVISKYEEATGKKFEEEEEETIILQGSDIVREQF